MLIAWRAEDFDEAEFFRLFYGGGCCPFAAVREFGE